MKEKIQRLLDLSSLKIRLGWVFSFYVIAIVVIAGGVLYLLHPAKNISEAISIEQLAIEEYTKLTNHLHESQRHLYHFAMSERSFFQRQREKVWVEKIHPYSESIRRKVANPNLTGIKRKQYEFLIKELYLYDSLQLVWEDEIYRKIKISTEVNEEGASLEVYSEEDDLENEDLENEENTDFFELNESDENIEFFDLNEGDTQSDEEGEEDDDFFFEAVFPPLYPPSGAMDRIRQAELDQFNLIQKELLYANYETLEKLRYLAKTQEDAQRKAYGFAWISFLIFFIPGVYFVSRVPMQLIIPFRQLKAFYDELVLGKFPEKLPNRNDEFGELNLQSNKLVDQLRNISEFALAVGRGEKNKSLQLSSENDILGRSLLDMEQELAKTREQESRRNWATKGQADLADVLRNDDDIESLSDDLIRHLVEYLNANIGALYILERDENGNELLKLQAAYGWGRKKLYSTTIDIGEGIVGQVYLEKKSQVLKNLPEGYLKINTGLGELIPTEVIVVPALTEGQVPAVLELGSRQSFEKHQIDFLESAGENIAAAIIDAKKASEQQRLLETSKQMQEQLRAQEEEMRQNLEEMEATQEENNRNIRLLEQRIKQLERENNELKNRSST
ncbi:MAG: GAF domain-containing protein [Cyclobacteriaceae bacterium]|nr:GAF domain-containing protein [Cyclobacteriaceae bacterium]MCH8514964.1 GAF domain-containing protein [Cyclobacteriaceae bacterium]